MRSRESAEESASIVAVAAVRAQLERILGSEFFRRSERLSCFLRFVVDQTLSGQGDGLKEQVVAAEVYGKRVGFNAADDPAVRNDARRLRDKLREYYEAFPRDPITISLPKGGYTPTFELRQSDPAVPIAGPGSRRDVPPAIAGARWSRAARLATVGLAVLATFLVVWVSRDRVLPSETSLWPVIPLSSLPGSEGGPTLSPDGNFVAFKWYGADNSRLKGDLLVKTVGGEETRVLATTPEAGFAEWSPDGTQIAFARDVRVCS